MHPIKVLNQAIAKVLKLMFVLFASLEKSHFFSRQHHHFFVLLHAEQIGKRSVRKSES